MYKIISVGGSIIVPQTGFDLEFLKKFKKLILARVKKGDKFILMIGGGAVCRNYQKALVKINKVSNNDLDWLGIKITRINAEFVRLFFGDLAYKEIITDSTKKVKTDKPIIVCGGYKPGWSTDTCAVLLAKAYGAKTVVNLSNIDFVYDKDPNKFSNAKKIEKTNWQEMRKIVGDKWTPGANLPFDPIAAKLAQKEKMTVIFAKGTDLKAFDNILSNKPAKGTVIE